MYRMDTCKSYKCYRYCELVVVVSIVLLCVDAKYNILVIFIDIKLLGIKGL